ncbi:electron transport complex, RnfABCDGE type, B subunit [Beggiatoa alba B18LD]|uniref:Ion-translocating oxidoreductase complex subunit B n=1 Tax=Beggiatoa alba B18LD TaxID=395493 RepID=I3CCB3_9GAMM|nr:RnfABCDGE type electron transport complex subunit B [Beggiatoa alba]EIJ41256.1 electron transport complex, RnfABCDGE type, B subunit [Beggiatoa alba B18LD]
MVAAVFCLTILGFVLGIGLGYAARIFKVEKNPIVEEILAILPNSNCGQCGFPGCAGAADALATGQAPVTCCPPGGRALAEELAVKLNVSFDASAVADSVPMLAGIDENNCIGCARCIKHCPTDAIIGAPKQIHAVIKDACTGCSACVDHCPTECLQMRPIEVTLKTWRWDKPAEQLPVAA